MKFCEGWRLATVAIFTWMGAEDWQKKIPVIVRSVSQKITDEKHYPLQRNKQCLQVLAILSLTSQPCAIARFIFQFYEEGEGGSYLRLLGYKRNLLNWFKPRGKKSSGRRSRGVLMSLLSFSPPGGGTRSGNQYPRSLTISLSASLLLWGSASFSLFHSVIRDDHLTLALYNFTSTSVSRPQF